MHLLEYNGLIAGFTRFAAAALMVWVTLKMAFLAFFASDAAARRQRRTRVR